MNKTKIFGILIALAAPAVPVFGADTGTLVLSGTVPGILEITVTPAPAASNLDLTADQTDVAVATVTERSNKKAGYLVSLESANGGLLKSADVANTDSLSYNLSYGGSPVVLTGGAVTVTDAGGKTSGLGTEKPVTISYTAPAELLYEDSYSDTLTFQIIAK